jgi:hypothetical protein
LMTSSHGHEFMTTLKGAFEFKTRLFQLEH